MSTKPTYEELLKRVKALEEEKRALMRDLSPETEDFGSTETGVFQAHRDPEGGSMPLGFVIDAPELQSIMDDFHKLTGMVTAILDTDGNIIEATGWQDICTKFHRVHPEAAQNCTESDLYLVKNMKPGEYIEYECKNGLRDIATPLYIGKKHIGNIYTGQFFYDDELVDEKKFIRQADVYGFDKEAYLDALRSIPRYSREKIRHLMDFMVKFTSYISNLGYVRPMP